MEGTRAPSKPPQEEVIEMHNGDIIKGDTLESEIRLTSEEQELQAKLERRLVWKLDLFILPILSLMYFLSSMGRADLGNAQIAGLTLDLKISPQQYSNVANMYLVGYIVFQLPGTILVRKLGPPLQFGCAMLGWGIFTVCLMKARSYGDLMGLRFLIGSAEAFLEGSVFYMSFWYTYHELATRGAIYFSTSALAGSFNGLIAYGIQKSLTGTNGWAAWQWLFLIEGILPIGCAFIVILLLPSTPEKGHFFFTKAEQKVAIRRSRMTHNPENAKLRPNLIYKPLFELRFWLLAAIYALNHFALTSLSNFLPAIILGFGYTAVRSQLMSVIVFACALVGINFFAHISDMTQKRGLLLIICSACTALGYILLLVITNDKGRLAATCILAFGLYPTVPISTTWITTNMAGYTKRGSSTAMINMISQAFSLAGNQAYIDPPIYRKGNAAAMSTIILHGVVCVILIWVVKRANDKKDKLRTELPQEDLARLRAESFDIVGDRHIDFVYGY
ncbi:putative transporter [Hyphodiscus hymeniophilus]|uniref:Transporter n=1 Tax=Hyphodiscus hymeniophilus TaxID=353542 RepID=A0A9P6VH87_9HELO|nr:putative transporter [Hyphodiscus hymeniophilus]